MSHSNSLADDCVLAIGELSRMNDLISNEHPMRHTVRSMRETARQIMSDAARQATNIAYQAQQIVKEYDKATKGIES